VSARGIPTDSLLKRYGAWAPTSFDCKGAHLDDDRSDWLVGPCLQTRDSASLERSNYAALLAACEKADPSGESFEEHRFGHWAPGWYEIVIARPDSPAAGALEECARALADYPSLDDDRLSALEAEDIEETWCACYARDWTRELTKAFRAENPTADPHAWEDAFDAVDSDAMRELFETVRERINVYWEHDDSGASVRLGRVVDAVTAEDLEALPDFVWPN
jgi:hypothetical protein